MRTLLTHLLYSSSFLLKLRLYSVLSIVKSCQKIEWLKSFPFCRPPTFKQVRASSRTQARQLLLREQFLEEQKQASAIKGKKNDEVGKESARNASSSSSDAIRIDRRRPTTTSSSTTTTTEEPTAVENLPDQVFKVRKNYIEFHA